MNNVLCELLVMSGFSSLTSDQQLCQSRRVPIDLFNMTLTLCSFPAGLVIGFSMTPPILDSSRDDLVIPANDTLTLTCRYVCVCLCVLLWPRRVLFVISISREWNGDKNEKNPPTLEVTTDAIPDASDPLWLSRATSSTESFRNLVFI